ncbi:prolipoprotein diacylglyceryl transferase [Candidatus Electronema sp. TJ]|uniref:prolipoprotein diacylglyceryl transferase n=1 Tax=Candidatus Electronema sp. TJ TaxID=3401573 RepID=UPI003AA822CA
MLAYPDIDPVIFAVGPFAVRWYGLMYVLGFTASYLLVRQQARRLGWQQMLDQLDNLNLALIAGVILGGRLGYVFFYNSAYYLEHPAEMIATWQGGMSFHGGVIGVLLAGLLFCRRAGLNFWQGADLYAVTAPIGLGLGRIGNFFNGELYGRVTDAPWGMIFPGGGELPRHPSQLYEALLEGLVLFCILWPLRGKPWQQNQLGGLWPHGSLLVLFLICYGVFRWLIEFFREPDPQLGLLLFGMSMGQLLCAAMIGAGLILHAVLRKQQHKPAAQ